MSQKISRKEFFKNSAKYAAGAAVGAAGMGMIEKAKAEAVAWPLTYQALDVETSRQLGHDTYYLGGCGYGGFHGIISQLQALDPTFEGIPTDMFRFGRGGAVGWGTLCGAINGAAAAINLVTPSSGDGVTDSAIIGELYDYYVSEPFPTATSNAYVSGAITEPVVQSISGSPLCHTSVSKWMYTADLPVGPEKGARCARMTGDVVAKAVELLNANLAGTFAGTIDSPDNSTCSGCHDTTTAIGPAIQGKMECTQCHGDFDPAHMVASSASSSQPAAPFGFMITQNYPNPFNPTTSISFEMDRTAKAQIKIYNINGQEVRTLLNKQLTPGSHLIEWDGIDNNGRQVASGTYIVKLHSGRRITSSRMTLLK